MFAISRAERLFAVFISVWWPPQILEQRMISSFRGKSVSNLSFSSYSFDGSQSKNYSDDKRGSNFATNEV